MEAAVSRGQGLFGPLQLELHAQELGGRLRSAVKSKKIAWRHLGQFREDVRQIEDAYRVAQKWATESDVHSPVVEWLLDNYPIVRERIRDVLIHLPRRFFSELPRLSDGRPRIQIIADELILHSDSSLDDQLIVQFVSNVQERCELTIGECWALGTFLKLGLIERLKFICSGMEQDYAASRKAKFFLESIEHAHIYDREELRALDDLPSLVELHVATSKESSLPASLKADVIDLIQSKGLSLEEVQRIEQQRLAACQVSIANVITSLRLLNELDWTSIFEEINLAEKVLRNDPSGIYGQMDFRSRNGYRSAIEELSASSKVSELGVARAVHQAARKASTRHGEDGVPVSHVGYWLVDKGRISIASTIDYRPQGMRRIIHWIREHSNVMYFGTVAVVTLLMLVGFGYVLNQLEAAPMLAISLILVAIIPVSEAVILVMNMFWNQVLPVNILPKLELKEALPAQHPTFVVVPSMLSSERDVNTLLARLESHFLSNPEPALRFALLTDFADADTESQSGDGNLVQKASEGIERLNDRYQSVNGEKPFFLFHRRRLWNGVQCKWMGWERKRGKLVEFGKLLMRGGETTYETCVGDLPSLAAFADPSLSPFIITLDADTILPRDAARRMIGSLAHPLNRPQLDPDSGLVSRGYGILQPRVSIQMEGETRSIYHRLFASGPGIDPYASAASDIYQDFFGEGSFTGKGIYDLRAFESSLDSRFPENRILSHDLIEGCFARVAYTSDIEVFDAYPQRYDTDSRRYHRWTRGDWQIASWLLPRVPAEQGSKQNRLSLLAKWKILDNLRRSLFPITIMILLSIGLVAPQRIAAWISAIAGIIMFWPAILNAVSGLNRLREISVDKAIDRRGYFRSYTIELWLSFIRCLFLISTLPHRAWLMADAIFRTLWRMTCSRKNLLEWETASASEARLGARKNSLWLQLAPNAVLGCSLLLVALIQEKIWLVPWTCFWIAAPVISHSFSSLRRTRKSIAVTDNDRFLLNILSSTWGYFERFVDPKLNPLPPDNFQELPFNKVANRISPTNEGLFLVSALTAKHFGLISHHQLADYIQQNLNAWLALDRWNGHHFNWYDTITQEALPPRYISTVDSGNLLACYLTLGQGLEKDLHAPILDVKHYDGAMVASDWLRHAVKSLDRTFHNDLKEHARLLPPFETTWEWAKEFYGWMRVAVQQITTWTSTTRIKVEDSETAFMWEAAEQHRRGGR